MKNINLELSIEEANLVLEALGNLPFSKVYVLIAKIQEQASQQLKLNGAGPSDNAEGSTQGLQMKGQ